MEHPSFWFVLVTCKEKYKLNRRIKMKKLMILFMIVALLAGCGTNAIIDGGEKEQGILVDKSSYDVLIELYENAGIKIDKDIMTNSDVEAIKWIFDVEEVVGFVGSAQAESMFSEEGPSKVFVIEMDSNENALLIFEKFPLLATGHSGDIVDYKIVTRDNFVMFAGLSAEENDLLVEKFNEIEFEGYISADMDNSLDVFNAIFRDADAAMLDIVSYMTDREDHKQKINNFVNNGEELEGFKSAVMNNRMFGPSTVFVLEMEEGSDIEAVKPGMEYLSRWMICMSLEEYEIVSNGNFVLFAGLTPEENTVLVDNFMALEVE